MTEKVQKVKPQEFVSEFEKLLLDDNTHNILVRGYFDNDKLLLVFACLYETTGFDDGTIVIGNTTVPHEREFLQRGIRESIPKLNLSDAFNINGLTVNFTQWKRNRDFQFGFDKDFVVFHPVQSALDDKDFPKFCSILNNSKAKMNILITTNDFSESPKKLYSFVDEILILDTTEVDDEHSEIYKVIQSNLEADHQSLPY
ncbi:hypothetical protein LB941_01800 [Ligilactobacillus sp. WILCCON 0076]|uniref:Uncharacterized protein n=1 Tax=Ligilactobacillus ubinensis TaxID=2876789 RepID=A0A9X2FKL7_9LACO|nr:hypothetical protein [Ligilactobacillus ubinensis]MCP0886068.1 hypothetical protein [Ligilactobacillus ubinensis]